jgi:hypothetical protein
MPKQSTTSNKFQTRHYHEFVALISKIRKEQPYNTNGQSVVEVQALEDYLSIMFAADNPAFDVVKWRKALGRTDY